MSIALPLAPSLRSRRMSPLLALASAAAAVAATAVLFAVTPFAGSAEFVLVALVLALATVVAVSWRTEGRRRAVNRLVTTGAALAFAVALVPLVAVLGYTISRGLKRFSLGFLTHSMAGIGPLSPGGGAYHSIVGTLEQVGLASIMAIPLGLLVSIYVTEYGHGRLATALRFFIDVMTGVPSIVAGLFVFAFWVLALHQGFSGFAAAMSLAVLMLPVVVRTAEEMIRLVPDTLREASYALGVAKWRTILSIVLPTALTGITTGVLLAVARVTGETAPLLLTASGLDSIHVNPFSGPQDALPLFVFAETQSAFNVAVDRAWAGALTLILIVLVLYVTARLLTRRNTLTRS